MATFAVIGLDAFGSTIALELTRLGHDVLGIDQSKRVVEDIVDEITHAVIADATDEQVLKELNILQFEAVVVAIGDDIEASILTVLNLNKLGVKKIWVKASNKAHYAILSHLDVDRIIRPNEEVGIQLSQLLSYPMVSRYMSIDDERFIIKIPLGSRFSGMNLYDFMKDFPQVQFILLKRGKASIQYELDQMLPIRNNDILVVEGELSYLRKFIQQFSKKSD